VEGASPEPKKELELALASTIADESKAPSSESQAEL
jgi:hypothetical protein